MERQVGCPSVLMQTHFKSPKECGVDTPQSVIGSHACHVLKPCSKVALEFPEPQEAGRINVWFSTSQKQDLGHWTNKKCS